MTDTRITNEVESTPVATTLTERNGRWVLSIERRLRHNRERIWRMLTEPDQLARWSPVVPNRPLDSLGPATARENPGDDPVDATVLVCEPPVELVHRLGPDLLRWTLGEDQAGTLLTLEHTFEDQGQGSALAAGWHICLATLAANDGGADQPERVVGHDAMDYGWEELRAAYAESLDR
jgi:uncharacterized protein YndB with AHSA1/START domain